MPVAGALTPGACWPRSPAPAICPCHLPVLAAVLAGTSAGAFVSEHWVIAALALIGLFILSVARALQAFRGIS